MHLPASAADACRQAVGGLLQDAALGAQKHHDREAAGDSACGDCLQHAAWQYWYMTGYWTELHALLHAGIPQPVMYRLSIRCAAVSN